MREAMFIKKNVEKWNRYQHQAPANADETADRFTTLIDDLSYAKTFYPKSKVTKWLNGLAATIYQTIYQNKKEKYSRIIEFWKYELPLLFKKYHRILLFTFIIFSIFAAIGAFSQKHNPEFIKGVLGKGYVNMTEKNIEKGDPFGVYRDENKFTMFVTIAVNNIRVAFITFIGGLTMGILTLWLMWKNGLMLGCFHQMFFEHNLGWQSIIVIWIHGTIEIMSIVIAATAGFMLAHGILFPGTYKRMESFRRAGRDAAKVLICLIPFFIVAAFLESYITYLMSSAFDKQENISLPIWAGGLILLFSFILMTWYFVIWPIILHRRGFYLKQDGIVSRLNLQNG